MRSPETSFSATTGRPAITVRALRKTFSLRSRAAGTGAALAALVRPRRVEVEALAGIDLEVAAGERLALIGPNGAGKSTTIKILTGILHPTSGEAEVLGLTPWNDRRKLALQIGTVFGQRAQLWYHLPAADSLRLLARVYEIERREAERRIAFLADAFDLGDLLNIPVRKLSLGQRMRCEVAASFVHRPRLILLDEPSIGLDVVAKRRIRDMVVQMSEEEGVSALVTSHDAGDIEAMCKRVAIIDHGRLVYLDEVGALKRSYLTSKTVEVHFAEPVTLRSAPAGSAVLEAEPGRVKLQVDTRQAGVDAILAALARVGDLADLTVSEPSLEEVIHAVFSGRHAPGAPR